MSQIKKNELRTLSPQFLSGGQNPTLPSGWRWVRLGEVCEIFMGQSPPGDTYNDKSVGLPFFQGKADFTDYFPKIRVWCNQPLKIAREGDILISVRAPVGPVNMSNLECCIGRGLAAIRCKDNTINWFIFWYLRNIEIDITSLGSGSTFSAITRDALIDLQIPLPPIETQRRIASKIQELMEEVERARTACEKQLEAVKALPSAYLREVFESDEAKRWERKRLGEVAEELTQGKILPTNKIKPADRYPVYGANGIIGFYHEAFVPKNKVLITCRGSTCGEIHLTIDNAFVTNNSMIIYEDPNKVFYSFLFYALKGFSTSDLRTGSGQPQLTKEILKNHLIPLPPLETQRRIASYLQEKMLQVEKLRTAIEKQLEAINALPQSILRKAFRGEL